MNLIMRMCIAAVYTEARRRRRLRCERVSGIVQDQNREPVAVFYEAECAVRVPRVVGGLEDVA